jgi:PAS domain S-box-containing protein
MVENNKKLLVVDDEPAQLFAISRILTSAGYDVSEASTGKEALEKVRKELPDLVLADVQLPDINGVDVSREIKEDKSLEDILVILISGVETSSDSQSEGLEKGADGYMVKPLAKRELLARIESLFRIKRAEDELRERRLFIQKILDTSPNLIYIYNISENRNVFTNFEIAEFLGYNPKEIRDMGSNLMDTLLNPDDALKVEKYHESFISAQDWEIKELEYRMKHKSGEWRWLHSRDTIFSRDNKGQVREVLGIAEDVTERKEMGEKIQKSLHEKEMLLKEIHHRVKNNLMVISSLLNIQSKYIKNKDDLDIFQESQNRAKSMALIHERLYQSTDLKRINFGDYIRTLGTDLFYTYVRDPSLITLNMDVDDLMLDINTIVPLGLIVNELITNSMKHAFPDGRNGEINIDFHKNNAEFALMVEDDGIGFPEDLDFTKTRSLGLQLVNSLTEQIDGKVELDRNKGTCFTIMFREIEY